MSFRPDGSVKTGTALAYASLTIPLSAVGVTISVYLPPLYASEIGLGLSTVGFIFMLARICDVVTDPLMGLIIDRYPSKWGRRKHWIVIGSPVMMLTAWFLYMPSREAHGAPYLFVGLFVLFIGFTLIDISHKSWASDLATQYDDRSRLFGWRELVSNAGTIVLLSLPILLDQLFVSDAFDRAAAMGIFLIFTLPIAVVVVTRFLPDPVKASQVSTVNPKDILIALRNGTMVRIMLAECFVAVLPGAAGAMYLFVARWVFDLDGYGSLGLMALFVSGLFAVPLWVKLSNGLSKHTALLYSVLYSAASMMLFLVIDGSGSVFAFLCLTTLVGVGITAPSVLVRAMIADAVDEEEVRSGHNRAGLYYSFMSTAHKLGSALSVGIAYIVLDLVGFDPSASNTTSAVNGLLLTFVLIPVTFSILAAACLWKYQLTKQKHESIRQQLESVTQR